jgi:hypothetical protein
MSDDALHTDGNAIAGLLAEIFQAEITTVERTCQSCASTRMVGAHRAYQGAGTVLRCPVCGDVAARVAVLPAEHVVELRGVWLLQLPGRAPADG